MSKCCLHVKYCLPYFNVSTGGKTQVPHASALRLLEIIMAPNNWTTKLSHQQQQQFLNSLYSYLIKNGVYFSNTSVIEIFSNPPVCSQPRFAFYFVFQFNGTYSNACLTQSVSDPGYFFIHDTRILDVILTKVFLKRIT